MHCRYCFRQNFPYETIEKTLDEELQKIRSDPSIFEVILSGGDPLSLPDYKLFALLEELDKIPHVRVIRFHTRFPIGIPERIDEAFLTHLAQIKKQMVFVLHINHPKELDDDVAIALKKLARLGLPLFCQSVLLKEVNDSVEVLASLCERLVECGITPYYLHQLDQVKGASRFAVDQSKGLALIEKLMERLPGYAVPRYVKEIPGSPSKTPLTINTL
jgi:KamA family protein